MDFRRSAARRMICASRQPFALSSSRRSSFEATSAELQAAVPTARPRVERSRSWIWCSGSASGGVPRCVSCPTTGRPECEPRPLRGWPHKAATTSTRHMRSIRRGRNSSLASHALTCSRRSAEIPTAMRRAVHVHGQTSLRSRRRTSTRRLRHDGRNGSSVARGSPADRCAAPVHITRQLLSQRSSATPAALARGRTRQPVLAIPLPWSPSRFGASQAARHVVVARCQSSVCRYLHGTLHCLRIGVWTESRPGERARPHARAARSAISIAGVRSNEMTDHTASDGEAAALHAA